MRKPHPCVLVIDDEAAIRDACSQVLVKSGHHVETAGDGTNGLALLKSIQPHVVLLDLKMPGIGGMDVLEEIEQFDPDIITIVMTGYASIPLAVEAMKKGAFDFIAKPFTPEEIRLLVYRGLERRRLLQESAALRKEQEKIRRNMISLVSHELRTPLAAAVQYLEVILDGYTGALSPEVRDLLGRSNIRLREMLDLIRRWLNLATMDPERLAEHFQDIDLAVVARAAIEMLQGRASESGVDLHLEAQNDLSAIKGNPVSLQEVFGNLINNAIKYNRPGGWVRVSLADGNGDVLVDVSDNGIGIAEEHQTRVFDEFYRVDGRRTNPVQGSGLGLSIVKKIVEAHDGEIEMQSQVEEGTAFRIAFPKVFGDSR